MAIRRPVAHCDNPCCNLAITCYHVLVELQYSRSRNMGHEISQFDIPDRQLMASRGQSGMWSDIGEAKITRTIFGRAKIRVVREKDKILRAWLLAALAIITLSISVWQGWVALQQSKLLADVPPLSERISVSAPVFHPEIMPPAKSVGRGRSESLIQTEIDSLVASPNRLPPRPSGLLSAKPVEKPVTAQSAIAINPQATPPATNSGSSQNQSNPQPHPKVSVTVQPATPAVAKPAAVQPAENNPAPVAPPAEPLTNNDNSKPSSASNDQQATTDNAQQVNAQPVNARGTAIIFEQPDNTKP
jgi:hypothetical protein